MRLNSFRIEAIGHVAKRPELKTKGSTSYLNLCLIGNDWGGEGKGEIATRVFFTAFGTTAQALANHVRKGDQLIIHAHIRDNSFRDGQSGEDVHSNSYIIDGFLFGAPGAEKREEFARSEEAA